MNALATAFQDAGYVSPRDRLHAALLQAARLSDAEWAAARGAGNDPEADRNQRRLLQVATDALKSSPRNWDGAKDAVYQAVRNDPALLWELFAPYRSQAVQVLLAEAGAKLRELEAPRVAGLSAAPGHGKDGDHSSRARRDLHERMAAVAAVARLSLLDTFKANGKPIGDLTPAEAIKWAAARERDVRFVRLLTANLPSDAPIRKFRTAEDTQAIYDQASREVGDAE